MDAFGCKNIIFSSSATVYAEQRHPIDELQVIKPINPYGRTKYFTEEIISDWTKTEQSKSAVILRYFNPVGAHKSGEMGENPIAEPSNLMPLVAEVGSGCRSKLNVFGGDYDTKDGTPVRDYIHILDLVAGHLAGLEYAIKNSGIEVFNLGTGIGYSVLEVINAFEKEVGAKITFEIQPRRVGDVCASVADSGKARRLLGWKPQFNLKEMCEDVWRWQTKKSMATRN
jgi:UDP-glucose 4-epimerase